MCFSNKKGQMIVGDICSPLLSALNLNKGLNDAQNCKAHVFTIRSHALYQSTTQKSGQPDKSLCPDGTVAAIPLTTP